MPRNRSSSSRVKWGYAVHRGTGAGGRGYLRKVASLQKIGLTDTNNEFAIEGKAKYVLRWLERHADLEISGADRDGVHMFVHEFVPKRAGDYYLEAVGSNFIKGGGMMAKILNRKLKKLKITFIDKGGTSRAGEDTYLEEETTLGEVHHYLTTGSWDDDDSDSDSDSYSYSS